MKTKISKVVLRKFRGASQDSTLSFDIKKPIVLIFGENGSGKSTIVDAIDFVANSVCGSLSLKSSTGLQHVPTLGFKPGDVEVEMTCGDRTWTAKMTGAKVGVLPPDPPSVHILRRGQILRIVEAAPAERYEQFKQFLTVGGVESSEKTLNDALLAIEKQYNSAIQSLEQAERNLANSFRSAQDRVGSIEEAVEWARGRTQRDIGDIQRSASLVEQIVSNLNTLDQRAGDLGIEQLNLADKRALVDMLQRELTAVALRLANADEQLITLLVSAETYLNQAPENTNTCPLCLQPVVLPRLRAAVSGRLRDANEYVRKQKEVRAANDSLSEALTSHRLARTKLVSAALEFGKSLVDNAAVVPGLNISEMVRNVDQINEKTEDHQDAGLAAITAVARARDNQIRQSHQSLAQQVIEHGFILRDLSIYLTEQENASDLAKLKNHIVKTVETVLRCRHDFLTAELDSVAKECQKLYAAIHPNEKLGISAFRIDPKKRGSILQIGVFNGQDDVSPQAYFSEAHLDTLGFCMWLALALKASGDNTILVIDDVFTSSDAPHLSRVIDLLNANCDRVNQVVITTHSRNWVSHYRHSSAMLHTIALNEWSMHRGITDSSILPDIDDLRRCCDAIPFDRQAAASRAGILLENRLDTLALDYGCALQRKRDPVYTLGELESGVTKKIKEIKISRPVFENGQPNLGADGVAIEEVVELKQLFDAVFDFSFIRNEVGAHFNLHGDDVPDADVRGFGERALRFAEALQCPACRGMARKNTGTHFACSCGKTKMTPLPMKAVV